MTREAIEPQQRAPQQPTTLRRRITTMRQSGMTAARMTIALALLLGGVLGSTALAQEDAGDGAAAATASNFEQTAMMIWAIAFVGSLVALVQAFRFFKEMMACDEGTPKMTMKNRNTTLYCCQR
jgi:hypothetical protein